MKTNWTASNMTGAKYVGPLEFQDAKGHWQVFEIFRTNNRLIFGSACNTGFLESGYLEIEDGETLDQACFEMMDDLKTYYNDGPQYVSRIVCNERM